ncbi:SBP-like protein [Tanacetum coccineum]
MHNTQSPSQSPGQPPAFNMDLIDDPSSSIWDWSQFLDFNVDDHLPLPQFDTPQLQHPLEPLSEPLETVSEHLDTVPVNLRVRKRDPRMACSNFLAGRVPCACPELDAQLAAEEAEAKAPGKKKTRHGVAAGQRVCLRCANATSVVLDGCDKRYCQQCGKFHVLSDFDEGKRSCRRKLERHNNRRRRKPSDSKGSGVNSAEYDDGYDEVGKGANSTSSEVAGDKSFLAGEGHNNIPSSTHAQTIHNDSVPSVAVSGETQTDEEKDKGTRSPSYGDDKSAFSSMCTTGRISFKLYDWNPAEFPRRLRHQLSEDPVVCIHDFLASPKNLLSGRDTFFVSLNNMIFSVMEGGRSVMKIKAGENAPKLHYVQPTCFEAGKPIEFLACGSNLLQPRLRFLVSFAGKYLTNNVRVSSSHNQSGASTTNFDSQFLNICVPRTELDAFGPGFIEVENESGLSNFVPILVADEELTIIVLLVDIAWLLKEPFVEDMECAMTASQLPRFNFVLSFLIEYESTVVLKRVLNCVKMRIIENGGVIEADSVLQGTVNRATEVLKQRLEKKLNPGLRPRDVFQEDDESCRDQVVPLISAINQDMVLADSMWIPTAGDNSERVALLAADCVMSVAPYKEPPKKPLNQLFTYKTSRLFSPRPLIVTVALVTCGVNLLLGTCINCIYGDGKPVTCGCEGPLRGGFCSFCASRNGNSFYYNPNPNSFNESQNFSDCPPQPRYKTYTSRDDLMEAIQAFLKEYDHIPPNEKCMALLLAEERFLKIKQAMEEEQNQPKVLQELLLKLINDLQILKGIQPEKKKSTAQSSIPYWNFSMIDDEEARDNFLKDVCTFLRKFSRIPFGVTPKVILIAWESFGKIKDALMDKQYQQEDIQELMSKLHEDVRNIIEEFSEYINCPSWNRPLFYFDDDDDEYTVIWRRPKAITPDEPSEEPEDPLIMGEEELSTIPEKDKSSVVGPRSQSPSGSKGFSDDICDNDHFDAESLLSQDILITEFDVMKEDECYDDDTLSDDDSFENINYVEALPPDSELVSLEEVEDVILRDKLSNVYLLISKIEALNDNPTLSSFSYSDNSFSDHTEETRSGSTTSHADISLPEYDSFLFEIKLDQGGLTSVVISDNSNDPLLELPKFESFHFDFDPSFLRPPPKPPVVRICLHFEPDAPLIDNFNELNDDQEGVKTPFLTPASPLRAGGISSRWNFHDCPDFEDSRAHGFVHLFELHILSFIQGIQYPNFIDYCLSLAYLINGFRFA